MTTLILIQKKILPFSSPLILRKSIKWFYDLNKKGMASSLLLAIILISAIGYVAALFVVFNLGIKIQTTEKELAKLSSDATLLEAQIQKQESSFIQDRQDVLEAMEQVSSIKYLRLDNFVFSGPSVKY